MAGWRQPGPLCVSRQHVLITDGTLSRQLSAKPGPICASKPTQPVTGTRPAQRSGVQQASLPLLGEQDRGENVKKLQSFLNFRADLRPPLEVDGFFGPETRKAVVDFQASRSIEADGKAGRATWYHLITGGSANPLATKVTFPQPRMAVGATLARSIPSWQPPPDSVMDWSLRKKLEYVVNKIPGNLPSRLRGQSAGLVHAQSLAVKLEAMAYLELFGVETEPGRARISTPGGRAVFELMNPTQVTALATTQPELDQAAVDLAEVIKKIGVTEVAGDLAKCRLVDGVGTSQSRAAKQAAPAKRQAKTAKTWVKFELIDMEGNPVGNKRYIVTLPGGASQEGYLGSSGSVRFDGIDEGVCTITFPDLDQDAWEWA